VASLRQLIDWLTAEIGMLDQVAAELLSGHDGYQAVQSLPGIGRVLGAVIVAEIGDITRVPPSGPAVLVGQADAAAPRVVYQGHPRPHRQAGLETSDAI